MRVPWAVAFAAILLASLSGCAGPPAPPPGDDLRAEVVGLRYPPLFVKPTPGEPFEVPGNSSLQWSDGLFAVESRDPYAGIPKYSVISGPTLYSTNFNMGWRAEAYPSEHLSVVLAMWDLPKLASDPALNVKVERTGGVANYTLTGTVERALRESTVLLQIAARDGTVFWAHLLATDTPEAPFTFFPGPPVGFPVQVPDRFLDYSTIRKNDEVADERHRHIAQLIRDYIDNHAGFVPESVDPQTLAVEVLASGKPWPKNVYTGEDMREEQSSGNFYWCSASRDGQYIGLGFDGLGMSRTFGSRTPKC